MTLVLCCEVLLIIATREILNKFISICSVQPHPDQDMDIYWDLVCHIVLPQQHPWDQVEIGKQSSSSRIQVWSQDQNMSKTLAHITKFVEALLLKW